MIKFDFDYLMNKIKSYINDKNNSNANAYDVAGSAKTAEKNAKDYTDNCLMWRTIN